MPSHSRQKKNTNPVVPQIQTQLQSRPWVQSAETINPDLEVPELQMEPEPREGFGQGFGEGFGHSLANISISAPSNPSESPELSPIQMKGLTIGKPGDKYEQEADTVARKVVSQINSPVSESAQSQPTVQRTTATVNPNRKVIQRVKQKKTAEEDLGSFLTDKDKVGYFTDFAKEQYAENEVLFWHAVKHFNKSPNLPDARAIYDSYIKYEKFNLNDIKNKEQSASVNISDKNRKDIHKAIYIDKKVDNQTFAAAQNEVESTINGVLQNFQSSKYYKQYKSRRTGVFAGSNYLIDSIKGLVKKRKGHVKGTPTPEERAEAMRAMLEQNNML